MTLFCCLAIASNLFAKQGNSEITAEEIEDISGALFTEMSILWGATNQRVLVD